MQPSGKDWGHHNIIPAIIFWNYDSKRTMKSKICTSEWFCHCNVKLAATVERAFLVLASLLQWWCHLVSSWLKFGWLFNTFSICPGIYFFLYFSLISWTVTLGFFTLSNLNLLFYLMSAVHCLCIFMVIYFYFVTVLICYFYGFLLLNVLLLLLPHQELFFRLESWLLLFKYYS